MLLKTSGLCPEPYLGDFLRRSPLRTFKTFTARGFMSLFLRGTDFDVAVCRATISGCSEPNPVERDLDSCRFSPLPDRNGRKLVGGRKRNDSQVVPHRVNVTC